MYKEGGTACDCDCEEDEEETYIEQLVKKPDDYMLAKKAFLEMIRDNEGEDDFGRARLMLDYVFLVRDDSQSKQNNK